MKTKSTLHPRRAGLILAVVVSLFFIQSLGAFWFICSYRDAAKAAKVAAKARERYYEYILVILEVREPRSKPVKRHGIVYVKRRSQIARIL